MAILALATPTLTLTLAEPASSQPSSPDSLASYATGYHHVWLKWNDNSTDEVGFRIERHDLVGGSWVEVATVGPNATTFLVNDPPLDPGTEYCFRVGAMGSEADSDYTGESCTSTVSFASISCTADEGDRARTELLDLLASAENGDWKTEVGLTNANPDELELLTDDGLCQQLWNSIAARPPDEGFKVTFFQMGNRYIVTEYADPNGTPKIHRYNSTAVFDFRLNLLDGVLLR